MKRWIAGALIAGLAATFALDADAQRRFGGGKNLGRQQPQVQQRQATPPQKAPQSPQQATPQQTPQAGAAQTAPKAGAAVGAGATAAAARSPWRGALMGLAAGLGIAALASWLGFGEVLTMILTVALIAMVIMLVVGMVLRRRQAETPAYSAAGGRPGTYAHVGYETSPAPMARRAEAVPGAARPGSAMDQFFGSGSITPWGVPADFDVDAFLGAAKSHFVKLQQAWDRGSLDDLSHFTTDEMFIALTHELRARAGQTRTEVVTVDAELLGIEANASQYVASVKFDGTLKVDGEIERVTEVWNLTKPVSGGGWVLAGIQQLA